jgi:DNA-binding transcriptional MerR regulator
LTADIRGPIVIRMDDVGYTVSELASCVGATSPRQQDLWLRRLRHWTTLGIIEAAGPHHVGSGRARMYGPEAPYLAAVLLRLADLGLPVGTLKLIAKKLSIGTDQKFDEFWNAAKLRPKRIEEGPFYVGFVIIMDEEFAQDPTEVLVYGARGAGILSPQFPVGPGHSVISMNISGIFSRIRQP